MYFDFNSGIFFHICKKSVINKYKGTNKINQQPRVINAFPILLDEFHTEKKEADINIAMII